MRRRPISDAEMRRLERRYGVTTRTAVDGHHESQAAIARQMHAKLNILGLDSASTRVSTTADLTRELDASRIALKDARTRLLKMAESSSSTESVGPAATDMKRAQLAMRLAELALDIDVVEDVGRPTD